MNAATLGAWGWLTDPDITEFYDEIPGTYWYDANGDGLAIAKDFIKKFNGKPFTATSCNGRFTSMKDLEKAMTHIYDEFKAKYQRRDLILRIDAPTNAFMYPKAGKEGIHSFHREDTSTHCKTCGKLLAWGKRTKATSVKCRTHPRAGKFLCQAKEAPRHKWYHMEASSWGLSAYTIDLDDDIEEEDYED